MIPTKRPFIAFGLVLALSFAGWRVAGMLVAEREAIQQPARALAWRPADPQALQALAESRLKQGDLAGAEAAARRLLALEPLQGRAYGVLAEAAQACGDVDRGSIAVVDIGELLGGIEGKMAIVVIGAVAQAENLAQVAAGRHQPDFDRGELARGCVHPGGSSEEMTLEQHTIRH